MLWLVRILSDLEPISFCAYQLKKLKEESMKKDPEDVFNAAILGGLAIGAGIMALAQLLKK